MQILVMSWNYPPTVGGIEAVVGNLVAGLRGRGHAVWVVTGAHPEAGEEEGVFRAKGGGLPGYVLYAFWRGWGICRRNRPDLILCGSVVPAPAAWLLSLWFRCPFVVLAHGSDILHPNWVYQRAVRFLFRRAARICANSTPTGDLLRGIGIPDERIDVVFPGVRVQDFDREPTSGVEELLARLGRRPMLLSVGRLIRRKGLLEFVREVMPALVRQFPEVVLVIVGGDAVRSLVHTERMGEQIRAQAAEIGLEDHVVLTGPLSDPEVIRLYFRSDVFVLPCLEIPGDVEGFGIVFLEAALAGSPAVATRVGGIPDAVVDGETGLLVPPGDFEALAEAVGKLLADPERRARLAAAAATRARARFSWEAVTAAYEAAFRRCLPAEGR
jgi:phosphatidyl-myo-inositol dimannoside synthase